jgi:CheY-like chemotaxis protein
LAHTLGGLVQLEWNVAADLWCVFADEPQLELALLNLIINARDAMPEGGTIRISAENREVGRNETGGLAQGRYVLLAVTDAGHGISPENLDKVMEPFFTTKEVGKGTGLGLSMVYGFAKQSNGAFQLQSELGSGTRAELWLPWAERTALTPVAALAGSVPVAQKALSVLLVDDHDEVRMATAAMLEDLGHSVTQATNGPDALAVLADGKQAWDLLVSDYAMPNLSGTQLIRKARLQRPDLPALIITGYAEGDDVGAGTAELGVLFKPFTIDGLSKAITAAVAQDGKVQPPRKTAAA